MLMMVTFDVYMTSSFMFDKSLCYIWLMWYLCPACDVTAGVKGGKQYQGSGKGPYVTQHHQMRHKSHTKLLSKWQIKEELSKSPK